MEGGPLKEGILIANLKLSLGLEGALKRKESLARNNIVFS